MMESIQRIFGTTHELDQLSPLTPSELAQAFSDPQLRQQLVQGLIVMSLIDGKANVRETDLIEQFAQALEVSIPEVKALRHVLKGEILHLRLDLARRFWLRDKVKEIWGNEGIRGLFKIVGGFMGKYENAALAARYQALEQYPPGSLGRSYWEYCRKNGFALPGEKGGAPELILFHDCAHVLSGYGTTPKKRSRSRASAQAFKDGTPLSSFSLSSCSFMSAFA